MRELIKASALPGVATFALATASAQNYGWQNCGDSAFNGSAPLVCHPAHSIGERRTAIVGQQLNALSP